jgi:hypothetical protein
MVQVLVDKVSRLRRHTWRLAIDMLAVASGIRPAFMADYVVAWIPMELAAACQSLTHRLGPLYPPGTAPRLAAMCWQGVQWVVNEQKLRNRFERILEDDGGIPGMWLLCFGDAPLVDPVAMKTMAEMPVCFMATFVRALWCPSCTGFSTVTHEGGCHLVCMRQMTICLPARGPMQGSVHNGSATLLRAQIVVRWAIPPRRSCIIGHICQACWCAAGATPGGVKLARFISGVVPWLKARLHCIHPVADAR